MCQQRCETKHYRDFDEYALFDCIVDSRAWFYSGTNSLYVITLFEYETLERKSLVMYVWQLNRKRQRLRLTMDSAVVEKIVVLLWESCAVEQVHARTTTEQQEAGWLQKRVDPSGRREGPGGVVHFGKCGNYTIYQYIYQGIAKPMKPFLFSCSTHFHIGLVVEWYCFTVIPMKSNVSLSPLLYCIRLIINLDRLASSCL